MRDSVRKSTHVFIQAFDGRYLFWFRTLARYETLDKDSEAEFETKSERGMHTNGTE